MPDVKLNDGGICQGEGEGERDSFEDLLNEIKCTEGKEDEAIKSYLCKHRTDAFILVPELSVTPVKTRVEKIREMAHILRPVLYTLLVAISLKNGKRSVKLQWIAWSLSLLMNTFSEWPQIKSMIMEDGGDKPVSKVKVSPIERNERQIRMIKLLLYLLRDPFYHNVSKRYLDSVFESLAKWRLLHPLIGRFW